MTYPFPTTPPYSQPPPNVGAGLKPVHSLADAGAVLISIHDVAWLAVAAGLPRTGTAQGASASPAATATAVSNIESGDQIGGNSCVNIVSPTGDYGIWQINRKTWEGKFPNIVGNWDAEIFDIRKQAQLMREIAQTRAGSKGKFNFLDWVTFQSGQYGNVVLQATSAVTHIDPSTGAYGVDPSNPGQMKPGDNTLPNPNIYDPNQHKDTGGIPQGWLWIAGGTLCVALGVIWIMKGQS